MPVSCCSFGIPLSSRHLPVIVLLMIPYFGNCIFVNDTVMKTRSNATVWHKTVAVLPTPSREVGVRDAAFFCVARSAAAGWPMVVGHRFVDCNRTWDLLQLASTVHPTDLSLS